MKHIRKGPEPDAFAKWKAQADPDWQPTWDGLQNPEKRDVVRSLLAEQGSLCCYCTQRVEEDDSHVEHLRPRKGPSGYPPGELDYGNMLLSCQRSEKGQRRQPRHCGNAKEDWFDEALMVSPLDPDCERFFRYTADGHILPAVGPRRKKAGQTTIEKLGLRLDKLNAMRKAAIDGALGDPEGIEDWTDQDLLLLAASYEQRKPDGCFEEFCAAISFVLRGLVGPAP